MTVYKRAWTVILSRTSVLAAGVLSFLPMFAADVVPTAFVSEAKRAIVLSGERVEPDGAAVRHLYDQWRGLSPERKAEIPVVAVGAVSAVSLVGTGTLSSLKGAVESGMSVIVR